MGYKKGSLCFNCQHTSASECSWFYDYTPVEGWEAIPVSKIGATQPCKENEKPESYIVLKCPNFEPQISIERNLFK